MFGDGYLFWFAVIAAAVALLVMAMLVFATRFKRCPADMILVIYGRVGAGQSARCIHGGGEFIWPLIQDCAFISLVPMTIPIPLQNALSLQNIRINVPSTFTVGISTNPDIMNNAAERLLHLRVPEIEEMAREIIFGQLRLTVASLTIEQINQDRESFLESIRRNVEPELNKIGLYLINVNITDITDESLYIESIGKKAAAEAVQQARVDVSEQERIGAIGEADNFRERAIRVAEAEAQSEKGRKAAEADQRVFVQQQETQAAVGEAKAHQEREIQVAVAKAEAEKGRKQAEAGQRIYVQDQEAKAITGENESRARIAESEAILAIKRAEAMQRGEVAQRNAIAEIQKAQANSEHERLTAEEIVREQIDRQRVEIAAAAAAEKIRLEAKGRADAELMRYEAEATGQRKVLEAKAEGYARLVESCGGDARSAATLLMVEKIEELVTRQTEAIKNLKIDKITVWDGGQGSNGQGGNTTSNFVSGLIRSVPPLHELAQMAGVDLPEYLGKMRDDGPEARPAATPHGDTLPGGEKR